MFIGPFRLRWIPYTGWFIYLKLIFLCLLVSPKSHNVLDLPETFLEGSLCFGLLIQMNLTDLDFIQEKSSPFESSDQLYCYEDNFFLNLIHAQTFSLIIPSPIFLSFLIVSFCFFEQCSKFQIQKSASKDCAYSYLLFEIQMSVSCGVFYSSITVLIFFFFLTFLKLCINLPLKRQQCLLLQDFRKYRKMGCCDSRCYHPITILRKRYGVLEVNNHFLAKIQLEYLSAQRDKTEALMLDHSSRICKQRMIEIQKKKELTEEKYWEPLQLIRANPSKAQQLELRFNMTLEEIIGLEGVRRKFEQLKTIIAKNVNKTEQEMLDDIRMRFQLMQSKLKEKIINVEVVEVKQDQIKLIEEEFKKNRASQIRLYQNQVDQQIAKKINFDIYTKRFIHIIPQQELMSLTQIKLPVQFLKDSIASESIQQRQICCCCR